jgi:hypothetical protein
MFLYYIAEIECNRCHMLLKIIFIKTKIFDIDIVGLKLKFGHKNSGHFMAGPCKILR